MSFATPSVGSFRSVRHLSSTFVAALILGCRPGGGGLSGTYAAKSPEGTMAVEFKSGGKVLLTMTEAGAEPRSRS